MCVAAEISQRVVDTGTPDDDETVNVLEIELTVSAIPVPIQLSVGSRVMFEKVITATDFSTGPAAAGVVVRLLRRSVARGGVVDVLLDLTQVASHL